VPINDAVSNGEEDRESLVDNLLDWLTISRGPRVYIPCQNKPPLLYYSRFSINPEVIEYEKTDETTTNH